MVNSLILDIETSPIIAYIWSLGEQRVNLGQIKEDWYIMAYSAKWLDEPASKIQYNDTRAAKNDLGLMKELWKLLDEADIVITQNGQHFDSRKINARFIQYGMKPPKPYQHLDTYKIARRAAEFTSHSLEYLTDKLNIKYKKLNHGKFPGLSLWKECLKGNRKAWEEMKEYNIHDVLSTEELYTKLRAWAPQTAPKVYEQTKSLQKCLTCGILGRLQSRGLRVKKLYKVKRLQCQSCGSWQEGERIKNV